MNKKKLHFLNVGELIIIIVLLAVSTTAVLFLSGSSSDDRTSVAVIRSKGAELRLDLSADGEYTFAECSKTVFEVSEGRVRIKSAPCRDGICVNTGYIGKKGQCIVCVPQELTVTIENNDENDNNTDIVIG